MLKLGDSLLGGVLWREAKGVAGQPLATAGKIRY